MYFQYYTPFFTNNMLQQLNSFKSNLLTYPIHPNNAYNKYLARPITSLVQSYHNKQWIILQDNIQYHSEQESLKRYYQRGEYLNKIKLLGEYYKYHFQVPRLFMEGIARIIESNVDEKRELEYALVTKQMNDGEDFNQGINTCRIIERHQRLIKDVELSYEDFEDRPVKKQEDKLQLKKLEEKQNIKAKNTSRNKEPPQKIQRRMERVDSSHFKGSFLVFKPRAHEKNKNEIINKDNIVPKYKKPKAQSKLKKPDNCKKQATSRSKVGSRVGSNSNSLASHQGLSRSKSKTQLHVVTAKRFELSNNNSTKNSVREIRNNVRSSNTSQQTSLGKSVGKKEILCDRKSSKNILARKSSKTDLKQNQQIQSKSSKPKYHHPKGSQQQNEKVYRTNPAITHKPTLNNAQVIPKKMFNRALQLKKKKL